jgi:hypothetical protein
LRVLSVRVREIVFEKRQTSYKDVADNLIKELATKGKIKTQTKNKVSHSEGKSIV